MYTLSHAGEAIGITKLERGDPTTHAVSGEFMNMGGSKALAAWIKSIGGEEDDGVVFIALNEDFTLLDEEGKPIKFLEGNLISVPEEDEVFIDITCLNEEEYKTNFAEHVSAMDNNS